MPEKLVRQAGKLASWQAGSAPEEARLLRIRSDDGYGHIGKQDRFVYLFP